MATLNSNDSPENMDDSVLTSSLLLTLLPKSDTGPHPPLTVESPGESCGLEVAPLRTGRTGPWSCNCAYAIQESHPHGQANDPWRALAASHSTAYSPGIGTHMVRSPPWYISCICRTGTGLLRIRLSNFGIRKQCECAQNVQIAPRNDSDAKQSRHLRISLTH